MIDLFCAIVFNIFIYTAVRAAQNYRFPQIDCSLRPSQKDIQKCCRFPKFIDQGMMENCKRKLNRQRILCHVEFDPTATEDTCPENDRTHKCNLQNCLLTRMGIVTPDGSVTYELFKIFLQNTAEKYAQWVEVFKELLNWCTDPHVLSHFRDPPTFCQSQKFVRCYRQFLLRNCPVEVFRDVEECYDLKKYAYYCSPFDNYYNSSNNYHKATTTTLRSTSLYVHNFSRKHM